MAAGTEGERGMTEQQKARLTRWLAAQSDADTRQLLAEHADLCAENAALRIRLARSLERERVLRAHRKHSLWGAGVALWDRITGRDR